MQIELHTRFVESKFTCSLIYFIVPQSTSQPLCFREASERRLSRMESQNGENWTLQKKKLLRKSRCVQIVKFLTDVLLVMSTFNIKIKFSPYEYFNFLWKCAHMRRKINFFVCGENQIHVWAAELVQQAPLPNAHGSDQNLYAKISMVFLVVENEQVVVHSVWFWLILFARDNYKFFWKRL